MSIHYIPNGCSSIIPYLVVDGAVRAIDFYCAAFDGVEVMRINAPGGKVGHAEILIDGSRIMLADENPQWKVRGPVTIGDTPVSLLLYVKDCDATLAKAVSLGATITMPVKDQFYGDRSGGIQDPFGHKWTIATHQEDVPPDELHRRAAALFGGK